MGLGLGFGLGFCCGEGKKRCNIGLSSGSGDNDDDDDEGIEDVVSLESIAEEFEGKEETVGIMSCRVDSRVRSPETKKTLE